MNMWMGDIDLVKKVMHMLKPLETDTVTITVEIWSEGDPIGTVTNKDQADNVLVFVPSTS